MLDLPFPDLLLEGVTFWQDLTFSDDWQIIFQTGFCGQRTAILDRFSISKKDSREEEAFCGNNKYQMFVLTRWCFYW